MKVRVLVADDAPFMRDVLREILEPEGFELVASVPDGFRAVEAFQAHKPDLVLLDVLMPTLCGLNTTVEIRRLDPHARIVMCSSIGQETLVMQAVEAGALDFVVKPYKPDCLLATIRHVLKRD